jgi:DNA-binding NtrC family response regulator
VQESTISSIRAPFRSGGGETCAQLLVLLEAGRPNVGSSSHSLLNVHEAQISRHDTREHVRVDDGRTLLIRIPDSRMSSRHARIVVAGERHRFEDLASKNGSLLNGRRVRTAVLEDGDLLELGHTFFRYRRAAPVAEPADELLAPRGSTVEDSLLTLSPQLKQSFARLVDVAGSSKVSILVQGETGTGKELVARAVHESSGRSGPFVALNCGALAKNLVEAELFGYRKGAFTGATEDRPGLVRASDGGTLFLDEIGDLPLPAQASLLRVLQEHEIIPVGATRAIKVDLRVVAATHRDLDAMVSKNEFRRDLLARLAGFEMQLPTLKERKEDLGLLIGSLLKRMEQAGSSIGRISADAAMRLLDYSWPLNIRQLERCLISAAALSKGVLELEHLPAAVRESKEQSALFRRSRQTRLRRTLTPEEEKRREQLIALLRTHRGNLSAVARELGKQRVQIRRWIQVYGIDVEQSGEDPAD